ncbi:MAG: hypothetical protein GF317_24685 [Candidatus Lokiarchaeota archaeon]|nr:hypothetical protein [Candidatus Lokiarchaeota archaeon]MBD3202558.1 hypothetical protein [Candidatus Lokiarchaeota archaeon]
MEIIAMGELREYLKENLSNFTDPIIFITSDYIPGCPKCNSSASVYYIKLIERKEIPQDQSILKPTQHKFPIDIYVKYPILKGKPKKIVIGTKRTDNQLKMILRRIVE